MKKVKVEEPKIILKIGSLNTTKNRKEYTMPIIKPNTASEKISLKVSLPKTTIHELKSYMSWAGFKDTNDFLEKATHFVVEKDREYRTISKRS